MEQQKSNLIWGVLLIVLGIIFLVGNTSRMGMETLWPLFPLSIGVAFWIGYFTNRKNYGLLMPGCVLVVVSLLFIYCNVAGWWRMESLWPVFILAPSAAFFAMHFGGAQDAGLLFPAGILGVVGFVFLFLRSGLGDYWPVLLIVAGILIVLLHGRYSKKDRKETV